MISWRHLNRNLLPMIRWWCNCCCCPLLAVEEDEAQEEQEEEGPPPRCRGTDACELRKRKHGMQQMGLCRAHVA